MASGSSAPYGDIIHVLGGPRCGLYCVKQKSQMNFLTNPIKVKYYQSVFIVSYTENLFRFTSIRNANNMIQMR